MFHFCLVRRHSTNIVQNGPRGLIFCRGHHGGIRKRSSRGSFRDVDPEYVQVIVDDLTSLGDVYVVFLAVFYIWLAQFDAQLFQYKIYKPSVFVISKNDIYIYQKSI